MDNLFCIDEEDTELYKKLKHVGFGVDSDLRIHRKIGAPFTKIKSTQIGAIISAHLKWCEDNKKTPEAYPLNLAWHEGKVGILLKMPLPPEAPIQGEALVGMEVPEVPEAEGEIVLHKDKFEMVRIALKFQDYYLMVDKYHPETKTVTLKLYKFMNEDEMEKTEAKEVGLVVADDNRFITEFGLYKKNASYMGISIDDFFKEEGDGDKKD
jgi:hypothetical protein